VLKLSPDQEFLAEQAAMLRWLGHPVGCPPCSPLTGMAC
jgi:hypothetical protein